MKYTELIPQCKKAIEEERCLGCVALEYPQFKGNPNCVIHKFDELKKEIEELKQEKMF